MLLVFFFFSSRRRHTRFKCDWSSDVCSSDLDLTTRRYGARSASKAEARDVTDGSNGAGPLDGLRLIDFGQYLAGPFGPMILADLGMDVIKVEPATGDGMRMAGKPFFGCQRGKLDIARNIKTPRCGE